MRADWGGASYGLVHAIVFRALEFSVGYDTTEAVREAVLKLPPQSSSSLPRDGRRPSPQRLRTWRAPRWWRSPPFWTSPGGPWGRGCWCDGKSLIPVRTTTSSIPAGSATRR